MTTQRNKKNNTLTNGGNVSQRVAHTTINNYYKDKTHMAQNLKLSGVVTHILAEIGGIGKTGNAWRTKTIVVRTLGEYPKDVAFDLKGDKIDKYGNMLNIGDNVDVDLELDAHTYNNRWFTSVSAWRVTKVM
jgi:hypothetical protein